MLSGNTRICYESNATRLNARVLALYPDPKVTDCTFVICDQTPFHPLDWWWQDQPGDTGRLKMGDRVIPVAGSITIARSIETGEFSLPGGLPLKRSDTGYQLLVGHEVLLPAEQLAHLQGEQVRLAIDPVRRQQLSAAHTTCHLAALALNEACKDLWRKPVALDSLGHPDLDSMAIAASMITTRGSRDEYRLGKSLRRKGFDTERFGHHLPEIARQVNRRVTAWIATAAVVRMAAEGPFLGDRRTWTCELPDGIARIPCGGTHVACLDQLSGARIRLQQDTPGQMLMDTDVRAII